MKNPLYRLDLSQNTKLNPTTLTQIVRERAESGLPTEMVMVSPMVIASFGSPGPVPSLQGKSPEGVLYVKFMTNYGPVELLSHS